MGKHIADAPTQVHANDPAVTFTTVYRAGSGEAWEPAVYRVEVDRPAGMCCRPSPAHPAPCTGHTFYRVTLRDNYRGYLDVSDAIAVVERAAAGRSVR